MDDFFGGDDDFFGSDNGGMDNDDSCGFGDAAMDDDSSFLENGFIDDPYRESDNVIESMDGYIPLPQDLEINGHLLTVNSDGSVTDSFGKIICYVDPYEVGNIWPDDSRIIEGLRNLK